MQLFRKEQDDVSNYNLWKAVSDWTLADLKTFFDNAYSSKKLGEIIYNGKHIELARAIKREIFLKSYDAIIETFGKAGSYETLITIIKAIFGIDAVIDFNCAAAGILEINISQVSIELSNWITKDGGNVAALNGGNLVFQIFINQILIDEVLNLFNQFIKPAGIVYLIGVEYA